MTILTLTVDIRSDIELLILDQMCYNIPTTYTIGQKPIATQKNLRYYHQSPAKLLLRRWYSVIGSFAGLCFCGRDMKRKSSSEYHQLAEKRGFKWIGDKLPKNGRIKTLWQCKEQHQWLMRYNNIYSGQGCPFCSKSIRLMVKDYYDLANQRNFLWLDKELPTNGHVKTRWQCSDGHQWNACYNSIKMGSGCPFCAGRGPKTFDDYHSLAKSRGFLWIDKDLPKNNRTLTTWQCQRGHQWKARYHNIKAGNNCPFCSDSRGETRIYRFLRSYYIYPERQKKFDECKDKRYLPFDFFFSLDNRLFLIEYDGEQHFMPTSNWYGRGRLEEVRRRDTIKNIFALKNGFILIRVPYTEKYIENFLIIEIEKH